MSKILVVDDEPHLRLILQRQLEAEGYEVSTACDGFEAIAHFERETPDLVLLDVMMPRMDGLGVLEWMKKNYRTASVPVIFLTARSEHQEKVEGLSAGANDYLTKPYEKAELVARIRSMLAFSERQRQASPLTGLPGNAVIRETLALRMQTGEPLALVHSDLDSFKAYNDFYGYPRGDQVIVKTAAVIAETLDELSPDDQFIGHVGGDDFVIITSPDFAEAFADLLVSRFDELAPSFYDEADRRRGYIEVANRKGELERFPLMTMTVAVIADEAGRYGHPGAIGSVISELKRHGKSQSRSIVVTDRRGEDPDVARKTGTET